MNIPDEVINKAVTCILSFYNFALQSAKTDHYRTVLQNRYTDQLLGIKILVRHDPAKLAFVQSAIKSVVNNTPFQSGDACRHPVQSPDVVGQGGTSARLSGSVCYQCENIVPYLFADSRCKDCTRLTLEEVQGNVLDSSDVVGQGGTQ